MKNSVVQSLKDKKWYFLMHDVKNRLHPAVMALENFSQTLLIPEMGEMRLEAVDQEGSEISIKEDPRAQQILSILRNLDTNAQKSVSVKEEPSEEEKEKVCNNYKRELAAALGQALALEKSMTERRGSEKYLFQVKVAITAIRETQRIIDPSLPRESTQFAQLIQDNRNEHKVQLDQKGNEVSIEFSPPESALVTIIRGEYAVLINSIIGNCLANSNRFTEKGKISIVVKLVEKDDFFELAIKDSGCGMPPDILESVRLGKLGTTRGGHGVGLGQLYSEVKGLGGEMTVHSSESATNHGTQLIWKLPKKILEPTVPSASHAFSALASTVPQSREEERPFTIYFIDDDPTNRAIMRRAIEKEITQRSTTSQVFKKVRVEAISNPDKITSIELSQPEKDNIAGIVTNVHLGLSGGRTGVTEAIKIRPMLRPGAPIYTYSADTKEAITPTQKEELEKFKRSIDGHVMKSASFSTHMAPFFHQVETCLKKKPEEVKKKNKSLVITPFTGSTG